MKASTGAGVGGRAGEDLRMYLPWLKRDECTAFCLKHALFFKYLVSLSPTIPTLYLDEFYLDLRSSLDCRLLPSTVWFRDLVYHGTGLFALGSQQTVTSLPS